MERGTVRAPRVPRTQEHAGLDPGQVLELRYTQGAAAAQRSNPRASPTPSFSSGGGLGLGGRFAQQTSESDLLKRRLASLPPPVCVGGGTECLPFGWFNSPA